MIIQGRPTRLNHPTEKVQNPSLAAVKEIEPWMNSDKYVLNFAEAPEEIPHVPMVKGGRVQNFQSPRYTTLARLRAAKTLDDLW